MIVNQTKVDPYNPTISLNPTINQPGVCRDVPLLNALDYIKKGRWQESIEIVSDFVSKNPKDKKGKNELKEELLPIICFNGKFKHREKKTESLIASSGVMVIDWDGFKSRREAEEHRDKFNSHPNVYAVFLSPSYTGFKGLVRIPLVKNDKEFKLYYNAFLEEWNKDNADGDMPAAVRLDKSGADICRACFVSYDPNLFYNFEAPIFEKKLEAKVKKSAVASSNGLFQNGGSDHDIYARVKAFDRPSSYTDGQKNEFIVSIAGHCCEYGVSQQFAIASILHDYVTDPREQEENTTRIKGIYKSRVANSQSLSSIVPTTKKQVEEADAPEADSDDDDSFFKLVKDAKKKDEDIYKVTILTENLFKFLEKKGFYKLYRSDEGQPVFVHSVDNVVSLTSASRIKDFILKEVTKIDLSPYAIEGNNLVETIIANPRFGADNFLNALGNIEIDPLRGTKDAEYLYFSNGIVKITKDRSSLINYKDAGKMVWKDSIVDRDFTPAKDYTNDYQKFVNNVSTEEPEKLESALGYMLSSYKDPSNAKCVIFNDEIVGTDPQGGSGKDLLIESINQLRNNHEYNAKHWKSGDSFAFDEITESTHLINIMDASNKFKFEDIFNLITGALNVNPKGKSKFTIPFSLSPKFAITTNYVIEGNSDSHERRKADYELKKVYGLKHTPMDDFKGKRFFDDWNPQEYNNFDNYMVYCVQTFLEKGLVRQGDNNIKVKRLIAGTSKLFYDWAKECIDDRYKAYVNSETQAKYMKDTEMEFNLTGHMFAKWTQNYADFKGWYKHYKTINKKRCFIYYLKDDNLKDPAIKITSSNDHLDGVPF